MQKRHCVKITMNYSNYSISKNTHILCVCVCYYWLSFPWIPPTSSLIPSWVQGQLLFCLQKQVVNLSSDKHKPKTRTSYELNNSVTFRNFIIFTKTVSLSVSMLFTFGRGQLGHIIWFTHRPSKRGFPSIATSFSRSQQQ